MNIRLPIPVAIALVCGGTPLIAGAAIFIAWCSSGASWLEGAGLLNILVGIVLFGIGVLSLILHLGPAIAGGFDGDKVMWVWVLTAAALLVLNFPVCGAIMDSVGRIQASATDSADWKQRRRVGRVGAWGPSPPSRPRPPAAAEEGGN